jgi:Flp pilus assembly pilin Flp
MICPACEGAGVRCKFAAQGGKMLRVWRSCHKCEGSGRIADYQDFYSQSSLLRGTFKMNHLRSLFRDDRGITALEFGLILALIAVIVASTVNLLGTDDGKIYNVVSRTP